MGKEMVNVAENEIVEVKNGLRVTKGETQLNFSQESLQAMLTLGSDFAKGVEGVTKEYFSAQIALYERELVEHYRRSKDKSDERKIILEGLKSLVEKFADLIAEASDKERQEVLINHYERLFDKQAALYRENLAADSNCGVPKRPGLLESIIQIFRR